MRFQVKRLTEQVMGKTPEEKAYFAGLKDLYRVSAKGLYKLRRYHLGRQERGDVERPTIDHPDAITDGKATAYTED